MSWTRKEIKERAKEFLREYYWEAFFTALIIGLIAGGFNFKVNLDRNRYDMFSNFSLLFLLVSIFIVNVLQVGLAKFFIEGEKGNVNISNIFFFFKSENYFNIVKIMFLMNLYIFLWSLLLIIPGIIKSYEYAFIPYLLAENPDMDIKEVFKKSKEMTNNQKGNMFVLDLSFIGWYFLGALIIIGAVFVAPYHEATRAQLYFELKE